MTLNQILISIVFLLILGIVGIITLIILESKKKKGRISRALNMSLFLITLPKKTKREEGEAVKTEKEIISVMEQFYSSLSNIKETKDVFIYGQPYLIFEIATPHIGEEISFYMSVPRKYETVIEKQIHGFYPDASFKKVEDYNIFNPEGSVVGSYLKLSKNYILPFKTYQNLESDPLNEVANALSKLEEKGEGAAIQIVFRPSSFNWQKTGKEVAKEMQKGKNFSQAMSSKGGGIAGSVAKELGEVIKPTKPEEKLEGNKEIVTSGQEEIVKALEGKISKAGFEVNVRLIASSKSDNKAEQLLNHLESAFVQFNTQNLNQLKSIRLKGRALKKLIYSFSFRTFNKKNSIILNTEELTSLFHFPSNTIDAPNVKFTKSQSSAPPVNIPKQGVIFGKNNYRGSETVVRMQDNDRYRHVYVIGQTGTGKSTLLKNMAVQDIKEGKGIGILDPHGDLIEHVLSLIPKERAEDVVLLDPSDLERPLALNMLEYDAKYPEQKTFVVNELISIFDKLYDLKNTGGPMFEQYARNALLLLMDDPNGNNTLMEVPRVLSDKEFRDNLLSKCQNIIVKDFWEKEAGKAGGDASLQNIVPYITSKFNVFIANDYMRPIIGQSKTLLDFKKIMNEGKILLVNLSKGRLGDINSSLLGMIVTGKILMSAFSRVDIPEEERKAFYLYMDEFQNFSTNSISTILSEARKYRLGLIAGHQFIGQLSDDIRESVFGNIGSIIAFRVGADDAEFLVKQFEPDFDSNDLINISNFNAHVKLMIDNQTSKPFNLTTYSPEQGDPEIAKIIKEISRLKYGRDKSVVDQEISDRYKKQI